MKRILVPIDFSKTAYKALDFALQLSSVTKAEIMVFHVIELPSNLLIEYPYHGDVIREMEKQAFANYNKWIEKIDKKETVINFFVEQSSLISAINRFIKKEQIDLVVMGTQGASGMAEFFVGSNTEKIVRMSDVPVFSIKKSVKLSNIKNIIFPTELTLHESILVHKVKELQEYLGAHLHIIYVNTPTNFKKGTEINALIDDYVKHYGFSKFSTHIVSDMSERSGIYAYTKNISGAIIAMGTHSRKGLTHFFMGSIAEDIVNHESLPIWTYSIKK